MQKLLLSGCLICSSRRTRARLLACDLRPATGGRGERGGRGGQRPPGETGAAPPRRRHRRSGTPFREEGGDKGGRLRVRAVRTRWRHFRHGVGEPTYISILSGVSPKTVWIWAGKKPKYRFDTRALVKLIDITGL